MAVTRDEDRIIFSALTTKVFIFWLENISSWKKAQTIIIIAEPTAYYVAGITVNYVAGITCEHTHDNLVRQWVLLLSLLYR